MTNIELIPGNFYYSWDYGGNQRNNYIFKYESDDNCFYMSDIINTQHPKTFQNAGGFKGHNNRPATIEEQSWLEQCIIANKYIEYDEASKFFPGKPAIVEDTDELNEILIRLLTIK